MVDVEALLEVVLNMYQKSACFNRDEFSGRAKLTFLELFSGAGLSRFSNYRMSD
jgi:hypothetical protein